MFTMGGPIREPTSKPGKCARWATQNFVAKSDTELLKWSKIMYRCPSTYLHRSSGTGRGTSRRYPALQRSPPGPGCTPACCSRLVGHPLRPGQVMEAGPLLEQWSQDLDPYSSDCSYSPWGAPGTAGQPQTLWPAHCCAPAGSPWCSLAWLQHRSSFKLRAVEARRGGDCPEGDQEEATK